MVRKFAAATCLAFQPLIKFAKDYGFYKEFIERFASQPSVVTGKTYLEDYVENIYNWLPQDDFLRAIIIFSELSGIRNPLELAKMWEIVPSLQHVVVRIAQKVGGAKAVLLMSEKLSGFLNNDQEIRIFDLRQEKEEGVRYTKARIYHYITKNTNPYLIMVVGGQAYYRGIPSIWGLNEKGRVKNVASQFSLERLIDNDFAFLGLRWEKREGEFLINGEVYAKECGYYGDEKRYDKECLVLGGKKREMIDNVGFSIMDLYDPYVAVKDFVVDDGRKKVVIFEEGVVYGNPCTIYDVSIPAPSFKERVWIMVSGYKPIFLKDAIGMVEANKAAFDEKFKAEKERAEVEKRVLEGKIAAAEREKRLAEVSLMLKEAEFKVGRIGLSGHDIKNYCNAMEGKLKRLKLILARFVYENFLDENTRENMFGGIELPSSPYKEGAQEVVNCFFERAKTLELLEVSEIVSSFAGEVEGIEKKLAPIKEHALSLMKRGLYIEKGRYDIFDILYLLKERLNLEYPNVEIEIKSNGGGEVVTDKDLFFQVLYNFASNGCQAMSNVDRKRIHFSYEHYICDAEKKAIRVTIDDEGKISDEVINALQEGRVFTTKQDGSGGGTSLSRKLLEYLDGEVEYCRNIYGGLRVVVSLKQ